MSSKYLWTRLEETVSSAVHAFPGVAGVCVTSFKSPHRLSIHGSEVFPTASAIKIHILAQLFQRAERGEIDLEDRICVSKKDYCPGSGVLTQLHHKVEMSLLDIATLMMIVSDNTATNICIDIANMAHTNSMIQKLGLKSTYLRRKMQDETAILEHRENVSTPEDMVGILQHLYNARPSPKVARMCLDIMTKPKTGPIRSGIPQNIQLANKTGGIENVRCDAGIVFLPKFPYAVAIMTKFGIGESDSLGQFITKVTKLIHETIDTLETTTDFGRGIPTV